MWNVKELEKEIKLSFDVFCQGIGKLVLYTSPHWSLSHGMSSSGTSFQSTNPWIVHKCSPCASGPPCSLLSEPPLRHLHLGELRPNCRGLASLIMSVTTLHMRLVWSCKIISPMWATIGPCKHWVGRRYVNLTKGYAWPL